MVTLLQNKTDQGLMYLFPSNINKMKVVKSFNISSLKDNQLVDHYTAKHLENFPGLLREFETENDQVAVTNKKKPHAFYDLMFMETNPINKPSVCDLHYSTVQDLMLKTYKFVEFVSEEKNIKEFNLDNGHLHIVYNFNHMPDRSSSMSVDKYHLHLNYWPGYQLENLSISTIENNKELINLIDPVVFLATEIMNCKMDFSQFPFVEKINYSVEQAIEAREPMGVQLKLKNGWDTLKTLDFTRLLTYIHKRLMSLDLILNFIFTGKNEYPENWNRHNLADQEDFKKYIHLLSLPSELEGKLETFHKTLNDIDPTRIQKFRKNEGIVNKHMIIKALNYSVSLYSPNRNSSSSSLVSGDDVRLLIQVKKFSPSGGAGQTFLPNIASLVNIKRGETFLDEEEIIQRNRFQQQYIKHIGNSVK